MRVIVKMLAKDLREHPEDWNLPFESANFLVNKKHPGFTIGVGIFSDTIELPTSFNPHRTKLGLLEYIHLKAAKKAREKVLFRSAPSLAPTDARLVAAFLTGK